MSLDEYAAMRLVLSNLDLRDLLVAAMNGFEDEQAQNICSLAVTTYLTLAAARR